MRKKNETVFIPPGFNAGEMIMFIATMYCKRQIIGVIEELSQNQIDSGATTAEINLNMKTLRLTAPDNGDGTSVLQMHNNIGQIGSRMKFDKKLSGEKNLGKWAPLGICVNYQFTSRPKIDDPKHPFFTIFFNRKEIEGNPDVEFKCVIDHENKLASFAKQGWTSCVTAKKIEKTALAELISSDNPAVKISTQIAATYRERIKETGIKITVNVIDSEGKTTSDVVKPLEYLGERRVIEIDTPLDDGKVTFDIFVTAKKQKGPRIDVDHRGVYQFPLKQQKGLWAVVSDVFASGHLQGTIHTKFCDLTGDRSCFKHGKELEVFQEAVMKFAVNHGRPWIDEFEEEKELDIFEKIADGIVQSYGEVFKDCPELMIPDEFKADVALGKKDPQGEPGKDVIGGKKKPGKKNGKGKKGPNNGNSKKDGSGKNATPGANKSKKRRSVNNKHGLEIITGDGIGYRIKLGEEEDKGKIMINMMHPDYREASGKGPAALDTYMKFLVSAFLASFNTVSADRGIIFLEEFFDTYLPYGVILEPRIPGSKKRKTAAKKK